MLQNDWHSMEQYTTQLNQYQEQLEHRFEALLQTKVNEVQDLQQKHQVELTQHKR